MDLSHATWRKSNRSSQNGSCVEVTTVSRDREALGHIVVVRDSKDPRGPVLPTAPANWRAFMNQVKVGELRPVS